jgi:hypothetical protein
MGFLEESELTEKLNNLDEQMNRIVAKIKNIKLRNGVY